MKNRLSRAAVIALFLLGAASIPAAGQIAGGLNETTATGMGGNNFIVGTVFAPSGMPVAGRMRVKLQTFKAGDFITTTDERGQFVFSGVANGMYAVVIDREDGFEPVNYQVDVAERRSPIPQTYTVLIRLVARRDTAATKGGVVAAGLLGVPAKAVEYFNNAKAAAQKKDHKEAIRNLEAAIKVHPDFLDAYNGLAVQYFQLGDLQKADQALAEALKIQPDALGPLLYRGIIHFKFQKFKEAEKFLRVALSARETSALTYIYLGRTLIALARYDEAEKALVSADKMEGNDAKEAHRFLAKLYLEKEDYKRAADELETYLQTVPAAPDADNLRKIAAQLRVSPPKN